LVVLEDADLDDAVDGLMVAELRNGGSACTAANRVYVADAVADDFVAAVSARMAAVRVGNGLDEDVELGPLVNAATRDKVAGLVADAVAAGASVTAGGDDGGLPGYHYRATVLADVKPDAAILCTEVFGPVLRAGMVGLNRGVVSDPAAPFGGVKQSGIGREGASEGIREFLDTEYTAIPYR
jgi:succinate-semialdehyde dehydrogenase / glutarate-semialdehyde dehydrogenase